jgi:serine/threonine protein phosphatase PrpC
MSRVTESRSGQFFEAHVSHPGAVRSNNEDAFLARGGEGFWVVADGMGGMDDGEWASRTLAVQLAEAPLSGDLERDAATVGEVVRHANFLIFKESTERQNHIGSTVVSLMVRGTRFAAVWAGDSRLYLRRGGTLRQVTTDHTQVQQMVNAGYMTPREAADHPMSHVLARAVGTHAEVEAEVVAGDVQPGDLFLLCSDGLPRVSPRRHGRGDGRDRADLRRRRGRQRAGDLAGPNARDRDVNSGSQPGGEEGGRRGRPAGRTDRLAGRRRDWRRTVPSAAKAAPFRYPDRPGLRRGGQGPGDRTAPVRGGAGHRRLQLAAD